jgi:hypothetical protein
MGEEHDYEEAEKLKSGVLSGTIHEKVLGHLYVYMEFQSGNFRNIIFCTSEYSTILRFHSDINHITILVRKM